MTAMAVWRAREEASPLVEPDLLLGTGGLVVIAPHPDDESLGCAALLAVAARLGRRICIVAMTDGENSHRSAEWPPERLAALRRDEQRAALDALGCEDAELLRLGLPDGGCEDHPDLDAAAERIAEACDRIGATLLVSTFRHDPHCDHLGAAQLADRVRSLRPRLRRLSYPIWAAKLADEEQVDVDGLVPFRIDARPVLPAKRRAVAAHRSQLGQVVRDDPDGFVMPDWFLDHHGGATERVCWHPFAGRPPPPEHFEALYAGGRDPWGVRDDPYEVAKREEATSLAGSGPLGRVVEVGCGGGFLAAALAARGSHVLGLDADAGIVERARADHAGASNLSFAWASAPGGLPEAPFDLLVLSEVLYFLAEPDLLALEAWATRNAAPGATCLLVNYLGKTDTPLAGDEAADFLIAAAAGRWRRETAIRRERYRIDRLTRRA